MAKIALRAASRPMEARVTRNTLTPLSSIPRSTSPLSVARLSVAMIFVLRESDVRPVLLELSFASMRAGNGVRPATGIISVEREVDSRSSVGLGSTVAADSFVIIPTL